MKFCGGEIDEIRMIYSKVLMYFWWEFLKLKFLWKIQILVENSIIIESRNSALGMEKFQHQI